jgi:hypothetical protein
VPEQDRPDSDQPVDRWHRIVAGRCASVPFQAVPLLIAVASFPPLRPAPDGDTAGSLRMFTVLAVYGAVFLCPAVPTDRPSPRDHRR